MERSALSASMVPVEKPVKRIGVVAKVTTEIRSFWSLRAMNVSAASTASESGSPSIDLERSTARTTLLAPPRLVAVTSSTRFPFSVTAGGGSDRSPHEREANLRIHARIRLEVGRCDRAARKDECGDRAERG